jgi:hypothetical protein
MPLYPANNLETFHVNLLAATVATSTIAAVSISCFTTGGWECGISLLGIMAVLLHDFEGFYFIV